MANKEQKHIYDVIIIGGGPAGDKIRGKWGYR